MSDAKISAGLVPVLEKALYFIVTVSARYHAENAERTVGDVLRNQRLTSFCVKMSSYSISGSDIEVVWVVGERGGREDAEEGRRWHDGREIEGLSRPCSCTLAIERSKQGSGLRLGLFNTGWHPTGCHGWLQWITDCTERRCRVQAMLGAIVVINNSKLGR